MDSEGAFSTTRSTPKDLPPVKKVKHTGCNTTPKIYRDRANQFGPTVTDVGVSPHCVFKNESPWSVSPEVTKTRTPDCDIPRYFTSEYQQRREEQNLPREITFQGPLKVTPEDPLPPHLTMDYPEWGVICQEPDHFSLLEYMEEMCNNITPPRDSELLE